MPLENSSYGRNTLRHQILGPMQSARIEELVRSGFLRRTRQSQWERRALHPPVALRFGPLQASQNDPPCGAIGTGGLLRGGAISAIHAGAPGSHNAICGQIDK
ncbi:hypothetical protein SKAU_G00306460 [Synaphobranchus kaupii]|uniref:Uncharacterized protein n=1 Tax=Synaphobranchus kaupii TaxID=118154 RepID=A0A9Q1IKT9_SYNKA|nr:hypothetical protein SKAU_G00306460 [Synaphobranchus kaupii]